MDYVTAVQITSLERRGASVDVHVNHLILNILKIITMLKYLTLSNRNGLRYRSATDCLPFLN